jgi:hypothetical protein
MNNTFEYDVVLSFAGEDRSYVEKVASFLQSQNTKVFYDEFDQVNLWGKDLYEYLDEIYRKKGRYCIMFISKYYALKAWSTHERKSAQARAIESNQEYILPARFDATEIPGILPTVKYIDLNKYTPEQFGGIVLSKLEGASSIKKPSPPHPKTNKITTIFRPTPSFDATLSEIEDTAKESMLTIITNNFGRPIYFPSPLRSGFFQKTSDRILYQSDLPTGSANFSIQDSLSLQRNGTLETIQIYRWEHNNDNALDFEKVLRQLIHTFIFICRWLNSLSSSVNSTWEEANVTLSATIPRGTVLLDQTRFVETQMGVARFQSDDDTFQGTVKLLRSACSSPSEMNREITRLVNFLLNNFEYSSFGKKGFARITEEAISQASQILRSKMFRDN